MSLLPARLHEQLIVLEAQDNLVNQIYDNLQTAERLREVMRNRFIKELREAVANLCKQVPYATCSYGKSLLKEKLKLEVQEGTYLKELKVNTRELVIYLTYIQADQTDYGVSMKLENFYFTPNQKAILLFLHQSLAQKVRDAINQAK